MSHTGPGAVPVPRGSAPVAADSWLAQSASLLLFLALALGLVVPKVAGAAYLLLGLISIIWLEPGLLRGRWNLDGHDRLMLFASVLFVVVWLLAWLGHGLHPIGADDIGRILRLLLIVPIYLLLRKIDGLERAWWSGLTFGALLAGGYAIGWSLFAEPGEWAERVGGPTNPIYFGGVVLAFSMMLLPRLTDSELRMSLRALVGLAMLLGLAASALSGSRGAWLAMPLLLLLYLVTLGSNQPPARRFGMPAAMLAVGMAMAFLPGIPLSDRIAEAWSSLTGGPGPAPENDSLAIRWQLWGMSTRLLADHWLLGGGPGLFRDALEQAVSAGTLHPRFLEFHHPHNQYLSVLLIAGLPGLLALALLLGVPAWRFVTLWRTGLERTRLIGWSGLAAIAVLAVMCLSESIFQRNSGVVWFGLLTAAAAALVQVRQRRETRRHDRARRQQRLSVIMICRDEADRIENALKPLAGWADEIIVLDSGSQDNTVEICRRYTDKVEVTDWPGFGRQKQRALDLARGDWVLSLDADEVVSEALKAEIDLILSHHCADRHTINQALFSGYRLPWLTRAFDRELHFGHWARAPLRLIRRGHARFTDV
ncbi:MAG: O-antigen ligase family protein, partial [Wenzhouxiangellaceae bacterium]